MGKISGLAGDTEFLARQTRAWREGAQMLPEDGGHDPQQDQDYHGEGEYTAMMLMHSSKGKWTFSGLHVKSVILVKCSEPFAKW